MSNIVSNKNNDDIKFSEIYSFMNDFMNVIEKRINTLENRIDHLEKNRQELSYHLGRSEGLLDEAKEKIINNNDFFIFIRNKIKEIEDWKKKVKILCDQSKKPHKCPFCDGKKTLDVNKVSISANTLVIEKVNCHVCEGKGIVWE